MTKLSILILTEFHKEKVESAWYCMSFVPMLQQIPNTLTNLVSMLDMIADTNLRSSAELEIYNYILKNKIGSLS